ncbi:flagellar basal body protein [Alphaproteobacteria bacterium]|nr:flagellar basal body protein [Alphaproteobacteria bacterium]
MASLFEIGKTGVQAYRQALSVTGQNIANINTEGYNKRSADITEIAGVSGGATNVSDSSGLGVRVANIRRSFDSYLSDKTRTSQSDYEMLNDFVSKLSDLENMLLPSGSDLGVFIGRFFDSLQDVASSPDSLSARTVSLEAGRALSSSFNNYDKQLKDFKSSSIRQVDVKLTEANLYLNQLVKVNGLISGSGSKDASNDILDARDQLLKDLSKLLNFTVDYESTGEVNIRLGDSGNGVHILQRSKAAILSSSSTENNISIIVNNAGVKNTGIFSSGIISGLSQFYSLVDSVTSEISDLAQQMTDQINNIQTSGINLNGNIGKSMFSVNSMSPKANSDNKSFLEFNSIVNNPSNITQEQVLVNYSQINNNWEVRNSNGVSYAYGNQIQFEGYKIEIIGQPQDGDGFVISPLQTKAGSMKFNLNNPEDFAAASKNIISKNSANTGSVDLNIISSMEEEKINFPPTITDTFTSSNNPLVATTFLKDGPVTTIPSTTKSINFSSIGNQSSATFTIADSEIKGFSSFNITLDNNNEINFNSAATDLGDGIKTVEELANLLNSGLMLDGKSQHDFKAYGLFASGSNGYLTIASSLSDITSGSILSKGNSYSPSISNIPAASSVGSNIQVFTRDGRHVSGTSLNASQIASLIKSENGFLDSAEYRNDYLNNDYRGMDLSRKTASGDFVKNFGSNISYNEQATDMDALLTAQIVSSGSISLNGQKQYSKELNSNITIACEKDESGRSFTVKGYDLDGIYQTETITGGNVTTVKGSKVFREVLSISINGGSTGKVTIGTEAVSSSLKLTNEDNIAKTTNIPVGSSAYYVANKLTSELAGTGVNVTASTKVMLGPLEEGVSGAVTFDLKGKNTEAVSINASVASTDLSILAKNINEYASQTGLTAVLTTDFKQIIIESQDGYNINFKNITAPSDFYLETLGEDFTNQNSQKHPKLLIDVSNANKSSANIKGEIKFVSSENFSIQTDTGIITSAIKDPLKNGYININRSKSGESATITPEVFNDLDNSVGSPDGKKALVGLSKYGIDINQKDYTLYVNDADSLYQDANPGVAGTLSLNGKLKDANNLNAVVSVYCSASETGNTFTVTGTNLSGTTITENITGGSVGTTVYGSTTFQTISSVTTSATASGNIKVGTLGYNAINDDDSLVEWSSFSSGSLTMDGVLSTSDYLGAKIKIKSEQDTTGTSFVIAGLGLDNQVLTETISGSNSGVVTTSNIFKSVTSINSSGTSNGNIKIGTEAADGDWDTIIDANSINADTDIEISTALLTSLRTESPTSQLKGIVLNSLPSEDQSIDLSFEDQIYKLKMVSGDVVVEGPENNRIKAHFNGTSESISNLISTSQTVTAATPIIINGLNSIAADSNGIIELTNPSGAGVISLDGALKDSTSLNSRITIKNLDNDDNTAFKFTITGTDQDGNVITDEIAGVNGNNVSNTGTKVFKTVTEVRIDGDHGEVEIGTVPAFVSSSGTRVSITSTANESNNSFTIVGTDTDGLTKTETITGPISGNTVSTTGLFKTVVSITPKSNTVGNIEIGTSPGYELIATAEGTIEGAQFKLVPTTTNINNAEAFGLKSATTTILGNLVVQPTVAESTPAIAIEVNENNIKSNYSIKFNSSNVPVFYNSAGSEVSGSPPSGITLSWNETSGLTDDDSIYNSNMSAGVAIVTSGVLSTTDDDSLFASKSGIAGDLILDGALNNSKSINGKVTVFCNGNETSNSFVVSGYDTSGVYQIDTITGVSGATATGSISFNEILSISVANNTASTIKIGTQATQVVMDPQVVTVTPAGSDVGELYTITGLDQFGKIQTEVMTAQSAGTTVIGEKVFSQITSIVPTSSSASTVKVGTQKVGRLSISHTIDELDFKIMGNPIANDIYGIKTQDIRAVVDNQGLKVSSFSGDPIKIDIPDNSIENSVAEKVSLTNLPPEDLITIVMGGGARKISAEYDQFTASENLNNEINPELTIKVDATNKNKVEIFDKKSGHSIASRILDVNRVFEVNNTKFQFSEEPLVNNSFEFSSNKDGYGDNRNIINILNLQRSDPSETNKGNFQEIFNTTVAKVGSNVQANKLSLNSASSTLDAAEASQSEFAGVNLDEEAARLLEFQQAYQASARILQTAKELFQSLIEVV